jgi:hypothetical protein
MDRRIKKTKDNIKKTYMSLLSNKSCNEINVVDIVNKADINRSTFYFHYSSMNELMDEIENDVINKILDIVEHNNVDMLKMIMMVADEVKANHKSLKTIVTRFDGHFTSKIERAITPIVINSPYKKIIGTKEEQDYIATFIIDGALGVFTHWIMDDCVYPKEKLIASFISNVAFTR